MANTVVLRGDPVIDEAACSESVLPGNLLEFVPTGGDAGKVRKASTSGAIQAARFALERKYTGDNVTTAYSSGDTVRFASARKGDIVQGLLADGQNLNKGAALMSDGAGALTAHTGTNHPIAEMAEAKDNSAGGAAVLTEVEVV